MKKRILALLLAFVMVFGMVPTFAMAEESAETTVYEALVASGVTVDGSLDETDWLTNGKLSGGQNFDILWDGAHLYFAATAEEADEQLVVTAGETTLATVEKTGAAFEAAVAYTTKGVSVIENVTLAIGESTWTGNVSLVKMARTEKVTKSKLGSASTVNYGTVTTSDNGEKITFALAAQPAANSKLAVLTEYGMPFSTLDQRSGDIAMEFTFDPTAIPACANGSIGVTNGVYAGFELTLTDETINGARISLGNKADSGLYVRVMVTSGVKKEISLGRTVADGAFDMKMVWGIDGSIAVYMDGVMLDKVADATNTPANMKTSNLEQANMVHIRAARYDYTEAVGLYDDYLEFAISNMRLSKAVNVVYANADDVIATGTVEALVAAGITLNGTLNETAWRLDSKLGKGQDFGILWDGTSLYFAVEADEADTELVVSVGEETILTAEKTGNVFEAKVPYNTKNVETIEDVRLTVGNSVWAGDVKLVEMVRKDAFTYANTDCGSNYGNDNATYATENGRGIVVDMPALETNNSKVSTVYIFNSPTVALAERTDSVAFEFTFDPAMMPALATDGIVGASNSVWSGLEAILADGNGAAIRFGVGYYGGKLFMNHVIGSRVLERTALGKDLTSGAFEVKIVWNADDSVDVYVDGLLLNSVSAAASTDAEMGTIGYSTNNMIHLRGTRYDYTVEAGYYDDPLKFTLSDMRLSVPCTVEYSAVATGTHEALVADSITLDGKMDEFAWMPYGELGLGQAFDILFDGGALYFGVEAAEGDELMTVAIGDETVLEATLATGTSAFEAKLEYLTKDVETIEDVTITVGGSVWTGSIDLVKYVRTELMTLSGGGDVAPTAYGNGMSFNLPADAANTSKDYRSYGLKGSTALQQRGDGVHFEFDFDPSGMTAHDGATQYVSGWAPNAGFNGMMIGPNKERVVFGIDNIEGTGLVFIMLTATWAQRTTYALGRTEKDGEFHLSLEWNAEGVVDLYIDGEYQTSFEGKQFVHPTETSTSMVLLEARRYRAFNAVPVAFKAYNMTFSLPAELTYITETDQCDGAFEALFTKTAPTAASTTWNNAVWENFANGEGKVAALIADQKVYLAVNATGAVSATLGEETVTATADGMTVLSFENTTVEAYGQEMAISVSLDGTAVWNAEGVLTAAQRAAVDMATVLNATKGVVKSYNVTTNGEENSFTMISDAEKPMFDNSNCAYWIYNKDDLANAYDTSMSNLLEQTIRVDAMPIGDKTGGYNYPNQYQGWGYTTMLEFPSAVVTGQYDFFTNVLYPDAEGNLYLSIMKPSKDASYDPIALGKEIGETFKLGMLCNTDGSQVIYVDDVAVATVANARVISGGIYKSAVMLKYMDPVTKTEGSENASLYVKDVTVTKVGVENLIDMEAEITKEAIFGSIDLTKVSNDLPLVTKFQTAYLGEQTLRWTSSNEEAVSPDGTVHLSANKTRKTTLSVFLGDSETALWSVDVTVPAAALSLDALLSETAIVVDGKLDESAWLDWNLFKNSETAIAAAWTKGYLYLAVTNGTGNLTMSINNKDVVVDLDAGTVSGINAEIVKNGASVEIGIALTEIGFNLTDYNQVIPFTAQLSDTQTLNVTLLVFSGNIAAVQALSSYTKSSGPWTLLTDSISFNGPERGAVDYVYKTDNSWLDHSETIVFSNDFQFDALPITSGKMTYAAAQAEGFYYYFSDENASTRVGTTICAAIFTEDGTNLKIRIGQGQNQEGYVYDLNKTLGQKFRVTYFWYPDNTMDIFVDGVLLGKISGAGYKTSYLGVDVVTYRYYSEAVSTEKVKFTISNQCLITEKYQTVLDELTQNVVFGRTDLEHVQKNLPMVTSFASANFAALNLKWTTSDASVVETDGTIHRHATEAKSAEITVFFVDDDGNEIKLWSVTVTVDPMSITKQAAPAIIHTGFAAPGSITVDGVINTDENWLFNGWALNEAEQATAYFGAQWDEEKLYIALDTDADEVILVVDGCYVFVDMSYPEEDDGFAMAISGSVAEIAMDHSYYSDFEKVTDYGTEIEIAVYVGDDLDTYEGTLKLTNVDWWGTDNIYAGLPMLANNVKSVKMGTADTPDGNQGAKQVENGWRLYDLYNENGTNPAGIRTYVLFMKMPVYENFADRTEATHIEFDFYAKSLPEWEWDEGMKNELARAFANYGITFSLSDKADAGKNSNVAVFGIVNTADGLVMVVNRGTADFQAYPLNKEVGEEFRLGLTWLTNSNLVLTIDGEEFITIEAMSKWVNSVGDTSFVVNMLRNKEKPTSEADNMDVYMTNIAFGKAHSREDVIRNLTFEDFAGQNEAEDEILYDLELPMGMTNGQLSYQYPISWTSSDPSTIDATTGKVNRPATGVKFVTLTASLDNVDTGVIETKSFDLIVMGESVANGNALVAADDVDPFHGKGIEYNGLLYNLDKNNNSIVYALEEAETINLVTLTDLDTSSRLNRGSLRLFYSDDNANYTEIEDYKLHHDGCNWYLYDFEVTAKYIKAHFTHRDYEATDFFNTPGEMIHVSYDESLVVPSEGAQEIDVPYTWLLDQAAAITLPAGMSTENLRVMLNGELLFHYADNNGIFVRVPDPTTGTLQVWNAEGIELADKENVYEVSYGTRETQPGGGRWLLAVKAGTTFPDGSSVAVDTLYRMNGKSINISTDGGYTWKAWGSINFSADGLSSGGWGIDSKTGRLFHEHYGTASFSGSDVSASNCITYVHYSDDGGKTWTLAKGLGKVDGDENSTYVLSYTDLTELAGNDGTGPNVDFVFPMGAQFNNNGAFCGRVAYTTDGGLTWSYSASKITYGNETAFEGGVSEATILQREDGTLVYYARCQSSGVDNFTISYSLDQGLTWLTPGLTSSIYTTNTQALMMTYDFDGFDGNRLTGTPMFMWGGNNVLGGSSYQRMPLNFAISTNGMDTFREIQNIFFGTFQDVYTQEADHYITNPSIQQIDGDNMYLAYSRLYHKDSVYMVVNNFTDWFLRTKGAYDSFEKTSALGEGWRYTRGTIETTNALAADGNYSLLIKENTQATRSVPYIQQGNVEMMVYLDSTSNFVLELQPAYSNIAGKCAAISVRFSGTTATLADGTALTMNEGWNALVIELDLQKDAASLIIDGERVAIPVDVEAGDYVTYLTILATSNVYVDELLIIEYADVVLEATDADKAVADDLIETIKNLTADDNRGILAAVKAYKEMTQVQQDLVNRNVPTGTSTNANDEGALINYYDVLMALAEGVEEEAPFEIAGTAMTLGNDLALNFMIDPDDVYGTGLYAEIVHGEKVTIVEQTAWGTAGDYIRISYKGLAAKEMVDDVTITIYDANGNAVSEPKTDSIREYAMRMFGKDTSFDTVLADMLNYGAAAQLQFNYKTDDLANKKMTDDHQSCATDEIELVNRRVTAEGYKGTTLSLESNIVLNFFYDASYVGKTATVTYTDHYGVDHNYDVVVADAGSMGKVSVTDLVISDCSVEITVTIDGVSVVDSVESYCARMTTLALGEPLMKFAASAKAYFAN